MSYHPGSLSDAMEGGERERGCQIEKKKKDQSGREEEREENERQGKK